MKKGLALLLPLVLAVGLLGCGSAAGEDSRLTLARKALPDEPELSLAGIANLDDVCLIWVAAGGGEEPLRRRPVSCPRRLCCWPRTMTIGLWIKTAATWPDR